MRSVQRRIERLEVSAGRHAPVRAVLLMDTDEVVVLSMCSAAEHERMPRAVFKARYPTGQIVDGLGMAEMWEAL